jgi:hypothetical protein
VTEMKQPSWRSVLPIHPAAELFPLMPPDERRVLGRHARAEFSHRRIENPTVSHLNKRRPIK